MRAIISSVFIIVLLLSACASTPISKDAVGEDALNTYRFTCTDPYALTQDCSNFSGATREISIDGIDIKICGSESGDIVVVMDANSLSNAMKEAFTFNLARNYHSEASNKSVETVQKVITDSGIKIFRVRPLMSSNGIDGYVLELDGDGYSQLKKYSKKL